MCYVQRVTAPALLGIPVLLAGCTGPYSTLDPAGPAALTAAWLWWAMFGFATLVLLGVVALWLYAMIRDPGAIDEHEARHVQYRWIIGGGLVLPMGSITLLLAFGVPAGHGMLPLGDDDDVLRIHVTGHQWWWEVEYPQAGITRRDELHIPAGVPVDIHLSSADVIHSFWVPRLGGKLDAVPGHVNVLRLQADEAGTYHGQCAEFCGLLHAHMDFAVYAHEPGDFDAWLEDAQGDD